MGVPRKGKLVDEESTKPQFVTAIASPALQLLKLRLPQQFLKTHGKRLSNFAYLRVPNGKEWPIELHKIKHNVWLHRGWNQFADYYSISGGCILVFRYDGSSRFRVLIFDTTQSEIDYSRNNNNLPQTDIKVDKETDDSSSEESAADRALQRAKAFRTRNPSFIIHIRNRNLSYNLGPVIPVAHCRAYLKENDGNNSIILRINKRSWPIKCRCEKPRQNFVVMAKGWKEFVLDNDLQNGDKFVFELIDVATKTYNAHLFRISDKPTCLDVKIKDDISIEISRRSGKSTSQQRVLEKAKAFLSGSPGFILPMSQSNADSKCPMLIPIGDSQEYLEDEVGVLNAIVRRGKVEMTWEINYCIEDSYLRLSLDWKRFRSFHHVLIDDICVFKLISSTLKTYNVTIFGAK